MKLFLGIDPGKSPSICSLDIEGNIKTLVLLKDKGDFPHYEYEEFVMDINMEPYAYIKMVSCELPHSVFGASAKANFQFGLSVGACLQGVSMFGDELITPSPKQWQKEVLINEDIVKNDKGKKDTKSTALKAAKRILGIRWEDKTFLPTKRSRVVNHNMVDAFLIAEYARKVYLDGREVE